jgi:hypothetical protein
MKNETILLSSIIEEYNVEKKYIDCITDFFYFYDSIHDFSNLKNIFKNFFILKYENDDISNIFENNILKTVLKNININSIYNNEKYINDMAINDYSQIKDMIARVFVENIMEKNKIAKINSDDLIYIDYYGSNIEKIIKEKCMAPFKKLIDGAKPCSNKDTLENRKLFFINNKLKEYYIFYEEVFKYNKYSVFFIFKILNNNNNEFTYTIVDKNIYLTIGLSINEFNHNNTVTIITEKIKKIDNYESITNIILSDIIFDINQKISIEIKNHTAFFISKYIAIRLFLALKRSGDWGQCQIVKTIHNNSNKIYLVSEDKPCITIADRIYKIDIIIPFLKENNDNNFCIIKKKQTISGEKKDLCAILNTNKNGGYINVLKKNIDNYENTINNYYIFYLRSNYLINLNIFYDKEYNEYTASFINEINIYNKMISKNNIYSELLKIMFDKYFDIIFFSFNLLIYKIGIIRDNIFFYNIKTNKKTVYNNYNKICVIKNMFDNKSYNINFNKYININLEIINDLLYNNIAIISFNKKEDNYFYKYIKYKNKYLNFKP